SDDRVHLVHRRRVLQLAERAGGVAQGPVVLPPQRVGGLRRGDDDPCRRAPAQRLPAAHRSGVGIRLPLGDGDQHLLRAVERASGQVCVVSGQQQGPCLVVRELVAKRTGIV